MNDRTKQSEDQIVMRAVEWHKQARVTGRCASFSAALRHLDSCLAHYFGEYREP